MNVPVKDKVSWTLVGLCMCTVVVLTFMRSPNQVSAMIERVSMEVKLYSAFVHLLTLAVILTGFFVKQYRRILFSLLLGLLSLSAAVISIKYMILPNIIVFFLFFALVVQSYRSRKLNFSFEKTTSINKYIAIPALLFGFWYLHWVESPIWLNAVLFSPLGSVNCPTMLTICGLLCLTCSPRSILLEATVAIVTLYFGFFGIFLLGAYVDFALLFAALFLLVRLGAYIGYDRVFERSGGEAVKQNRPQ